MTKLGDEITDRIVERGLKVIEKLVQRADKWADSLEEEENTDKEEENTDKEEEVESSAEKGTVYRITCVHCKKVSEFRVKGRKGKEKI